MKIIKKLEDIQFSVEILKETDEMTLYKPFMLENPITTSDFPTIDSLYYQALEATLKHLVFKFQSGWIESERQVMYHSDECISNVHFIFDEYNEISTINVFQRSSNLLNIYEDVQFFNYFIEKYLTKKVELNIFVSAPHVFKGKTTKI